MSCCASLHNHMPGSLRGWLNGSEVGCRVWGSLSGSAVVVVGLARRRRTGRMKATRPQSQLSYIGCHLSIQELTIVSMQVRSPNRLSVDSGSVVNRGHSASLLSDINSGIAPHKLR